MTARDRAGLRVLVAIALGALAACQQALDEEAFQRQAEKAYVAANPGFGIMRRIGAKTFFVRGDQLLEWDTAPLFAEYKRSGKSSSSYLDDLEERLTAEARARRLSLEQAREQIIPIIKSGSWIRVQDLGAIGPPSKQREIRPWRKKLADDVFVLLGIHEELLGYRYASFAEVEDSKDKPDDWLNRAVANLDRKVGTSTGAELRSEGGQLMVYDLVNKDGVAGLILSKSFRKQMLDKFNRLTLGAALPSRDVLIVFDVEDFVAVKPVRARAHQLHDQRNHPAFRGLLKFDLDSIYLMEPAHPEKAKKKEED